jgi:hypothetical protein
MVLPVPYGTYAALPVADVVSTRKAIEANPLIRNGNLGVTLAGVARNNRNASRADGGSA